MLKLAECAAYAAQWPDKGIPELERLLATARASGEVEEIATATFFLATVLTDAERELDLAEALVTDLCVASDDPSYFSLAARLFRLIGKSEEAEKYQQLADAQPLDQDFVDQVNEIVDLVESTSSQADTDDSNRKRHRQRFDAIIKKSSKQPPR